MLLKFTIHKVEITTPTITLPDLASAFNKYRIVQISDFHLGTWLDTQALLEIVDLVNGQEPDLVAITGDFISFDPSKYIPDLIDILSNLSSTDGVFAVLGNHDHYTDAGMVRSALQQSNIIELRNEVHLIRRNSSSLCLAGIDDFMTGHAELDKVISQLPNDGSPVILLAHEPDFADISAASGKFALQMSGHTHGGQICLPGWGNLYLPRHGRKYPSGIYKVKNMLQYTNRGLGTSWLRFRYKCPPEITVFNLFTQEGLPDKSLDERSITPDNSVPPYS